ncbi:MAG: 30S ribosomal protein S6 [Candidatus Edwardsbacteria bacterium]
MRHYETVFILDSKLDENSVEKEITKVKELVQFQKGEVVKIDKWGRKRLAYEIKDRQEGYYVVINFTSSPERLNELERNFKLNDLVLKHIIVKGK